MKNVDLVIIGGGPAGLAAAVAAGCVRQVERMEGRR